MNNIFLSKKVVLLVLILTAITFGVTAISTLLVYLNSVSAIKSSLMDVAYAKYGKIHILHQYGFSEDSVLKIVANHAFSGKGIGYSGNIEIVKTRNDSIQFILRKNIKGSLSNIAIPFKSKVGIPAKLALQGNSGTTISKDYRGIRVIAAYTYFKPFKWGIVVKMSTAEFNKPFIKTGILAFFLAIVSIIFGSVLFIKITNPMLEETIKSEARYRSFIEVTDQIAWVTNPKGEVVEDMPTWQKFTGLTYDEIKGAGWVSSIHPDDIQGTLTTWNNAVSKKRKYETEYRLRRYDGIYRNILARGFPVVDKNGDVTEWVGICTDLTEKKIMENALIEANESLERKVEIRTKELETSKKLLDEASKLGRIGAWEIDLINNELIWSDMIYDIYELDKSFKPNVEASINFFAPEFRPIISEAVRLAISEGKEYDLELQLITAKQNIIWARAKGHATRENGEIIKISGMFHDINSRKLAEMELEKHRIHLEELIEERTEQLRKLIKDLERSNKELEQFAYVASHDLQEPLRMVSSFTQLLRKKYHDKLDSDALEYINYAVDGATRMQTLINDLLEYSRVSTQGKKFGLVDCTSVLGVVRKTLHHRIEETNGLLINNDLPVINGDESQLIRLFQNLIDNAIKFRGSEAPRIYVTATSDDTEWKFSVKDNGIGIAKEFADRVFIIFQRLHGREEYPGTGIGLAVSKRIVERHGGKIWIESEKGNGTTFFFTIPKNMKQELYAT